MRWELLRDSVEKATGLVIGSNCARSLSWSWARKKFSWENFCLLTKNDRHDTRDCHHKHVGVCHGKWHDECADVTSGTPFCHSEFRPTLNPSVVAVNN